MRACVCVCARARTHTHTRVLRGGARLPKGTLRMLCTSISAKLHTRPQSLGRWHVGAAWRSLHTRSESGGPMAGAQAWQMTLALVRADIQGHCPNPQGLRPSQPLGLLSPSPSLFSSSRRSQQGPHRTEIQEARKVPGIDGRKRGKSQSRFRAREMVLLAFSLKQGQQACCSSEDCMRQSLPAQQLECSEDTSPPASWMHPGGRVSTLTPR